MALDLSPQLSYKTVPALFALSLTQRRGFVDGVGLFGEDPCPFTHKGFALQADERESWSPAPLILHHGAPPAPELALVGAQQQPWPPCPLCLSHTVKQWLNPVSSALETKSPPAMHTHPCRKWQDPQLSADMMCLSGRTAAAPVSVS